MESSSEEQFPEAMQLREPVPIGTARFLDPLDEEFENLWSLVIADITDQDSFVTTIWEDTALPQAMRDRALLSAVGSQQVRAYLGVGGHRQGYSHETESRGAPSIFRQFSEERRQEAQQWLQAAFEYQHEQGVQLIPEQKLLYWWCNMFENGIIAQDQFETNINRLDILDALKLRAHSQKFPLISDIVDYVPDESGWFDYRFGGEKTKRWAYAKLGQWLRYQNGEDVELGNWCKDVSQEIGLEVCRQAFRNKAISYEEFRPALEHFGWDGVVYDPDESFEYESWFKRLCTINPDQSVDTEMLHSLVRHIFERFPATPPPTVRGEDRRPLFTRVEQLQDIAKTVAEIDENPDIIERIDIECSYAEAYAALRKVEEAEREHQAEARRWENSPAFHAQQAAQARTNAVLETVKQRTREATTQPDELS